MDDQAQFNMKSIRLTALLALTLLIGAGSPFSSSVSAEAEEPFYIALDPAAAKAKFNQYGEPEPAVEGANLRSHAEVYKTETIEVLLPARNQVEYMVNMEKGEVLLYSWEAGVALHFDFHAHPSDDESIFWTRYNQGNENKDQGSIVAPYTGEHGWLWSNAGDKPVTIKLTVTGYYINVFKVE